MKFLKPQFHSKSLRIGIIILVIFSFFLFIPSSSKEIKNLFYSISLPAQKWLWEKGAGISGFFDMVSGIKRLKNENEELKLKNQKLISRNIELAQLRKENEDLRTALNLDLQKEFELKMSQVIGKDISKDYLIIDKGSIDDVRFGFPVITQQKILVGKISAVYENVSKVQLLTSKNSSFDVEIFEKEIYGLARGKGNFKLFIDLISQEKEIKTTDKVITSALGGNFPKGLLVGEIQEVRKSDIISFQEAELKPAFNIKELDFLFIITNFEF